MNMNMKVKTIMSAAPTRLKPTDTVQAAAAKLASDGIGILPVVGDDGAPIGTLTDRDIVVRLVAAGKDCSAAKVDAAMTSKVVTCDVDTDVDEAARLMRDHKVRRVLVTDGGRLAGVASLGDLARHSSDDGIVARTLESVSS